MARVTHVKKAQQRYKTVPLIDPTTGEQVVTRVMRRDGVTPKTTKTGREVTLRRTVEDKDQPLPNRVCDYCRGEILPGTPYKWVKPKSGPYGGSKRNRHEGCPNWQVWDLSNSWSARIAQAIDGIDLSAIDSAESPEDVQSVAQDAAEAIRSLAEESEEASSNIEEGFGHPTQQSEEAQERADALNGWADDIENVDIEDLPEPDEEDCDTCQGTGTVEDTSEPDAEDIDCSECDGSGKVTPEEPTDEQMDEWRDEAREAVQAVLDECPV